ncbi:hypothetical protein [Brevundimonas sp. M20]|uniref:COG3650 family protein n=1 Tax=Brevundimonas sp. M20 TaxID=2591463 RepID=UPI001F10B070|nr:hypothetical protein [Brevundimonas sp. M20]
MTRPALRVFLPRLSMESPMRLIAFVVAASALTLSACSQGGEAPAASGEPPAAAPILSGVDLSKPVSLIGTEPFWGIQLTGGELVYSGVDRPEQRAPLPPAVIQGTVATFQTRSASGTVFDVTLTSTECSDGMSDRTFPLTALVKVGDETLMGCAASSEALARAGESGPVV